MIHADDTLIIKLAHILNGKQIETNALNEALELVCQNFSFDAAFLYEIDQYNYFNLKEKCLFAKVNPCELFPIENIKPEHRARMASESVTIIAKKNQNTEYERNLLELFCAESLVLTSMLDENKRVCGLIVFIHTKTNLQISKTTEKLLSVLLSMLVNYAEIRIYQNKLSFAQTSLESILDNTGIDIYVNDFYNHDILYVNKSMAAPYGGISKFMGNKCWKVLFPDQNGPCEFCPEKKLIDDNGNPTKIYSWDYRRAMDGSWFRVFSAAFRWTDGRLAHVVSSADITDNKRNEELVKYLANYDSLTGLPNRRMLVTDCENLINKTEKNQKAFLLFFDIDGFKAINDNFGHDSGDEFLIKLGDFFSGIPLLKDKIYRNGGDEFVALLGGETTETNIRNLASFIHNRFKDSWVLKSGSVFCSTSIGVACYPEDGHTAENLLAKADQSMYRVKKIGGAGILFCNEKSGL